MTKRALTGAPALTHERARPPIKISRSIKNLYRPHEGDLRPDASRPQVTRYDLRDVDGHGLRSPWSAALALGPGETP